MENLKRLLGPAPSELLPEEFIFSRLREQRARVERNLEQFRAGKIPSWNKKKAAKKTVRKASKAKTVKAAAQLEELLEGQGLSLEELAAKLLED